MTNGWVDMKNTDMMLIMGESSRIIPAVSSGPSKQNARATRK